MMSFVSATEEKPETNYLYGVSVRTACSEDRRTINVSFLPNATVRAVHKVSLLPDRDFKPTGDCETGTTDAHDALGKYHIPGFTKDT